MTGRGMGYCAGADAPGSMQQYPGRGAGRGRGGWYQGGWFPGCRGGGRGGGRGVGWRGWLPAWLPFGGRWGGAGPAPVDGPSDRAAEVQALRSQAAGLEAELSAVQRRLEQLEVASTGADETRGADDR